MQNQFLEMHFEFLEIDFDFLEMHFKLHETAVGEEGGGGGAVFSCRGCGESQHREKG